MVRQAMSERRNANRAKRILSIQFRLAKFKGRIKSGENSSWHLSTTHDMSISGLSFLSDVAFQINDILDVHVIMSGVLDIFKGHAKVVRVEKKKTGAFYLIAVRFVKNPTTKRRVIKSTTKKVNRVRKPSRSK